MDPCVTILLPTHNRADVLRYAILSAMWQTETGFRAPDRWRRMHGRNPRGGGGLSRPARPVVRPAQSPIQRIRQSQYRPEQALGRYITYAQHDDIMLPDHVERLIAALEASGTDWVYSRPLWCMPDGFTPSVLHQFDPSATSSRIFWPSKITFPPAASCTEGMPCSASAIGPRTPPRPRTGSAGTASSRRARPASPPIVRPPRRCTSARSGSAMTSPPPSVCMRSRELRRGGRRPGSLPSRRG